MYGMKIGAFHSYKDFGLVPTSKPIINLPSPKLEYIEIPSRHGMIDITESLSREVIYEMRVGSFEFIVSNTEKWQEIYRTLASKIHGKTVDLILDTEQAYIYRGRLWVSESKSEKNYASLTLGYKLEPYKYSVSDVKEGGEIVHKIENLVINKTKTVVLSFDSDMTMVPEFYNRTESIVLVTFEGKQYTLQKGMSRFPEIRGRKDLELFFTGNSTVDISYKRGWL